MMPEFEQVRSRDWLNAVSARARQAAKDIRVELINHYIGKLNSQSDHRPGGRVAWLQRVLPPAILVAVIIYEAAFEFFFHDLIVFWMRFALEFLIFGVFGAGLTWVALEWVRRRLIEEAVYQEEAHARERQLAAITAASADAIIMLDNEGVVRSWNRGAELLLGYTPEEIIGTHFSRLLPDNEAKQGELDFLQEEMLKKGYIRNFVTHRRTKDGRTLTVELTRTLLHNEQGGPIGSSAILRDVTERERAQTAIRELNRHLESLVAQRTRALSEANAELRKRQHELEHANDELKQLDELKSEFVSLVSHELRAPLANISGSLQLLLDDPNDLTDNQRELLSLTTDQVGRLSRLVRGILNVSRIEAGQTLIQPQAFDIGDMIGRTLSQWQACDPSHVYRVEVGQNLPSVYGDRDRVEEVLTNLLENAFKYSYENTPITVRAFVAEDQMVVAVSDQGEGISPEELQRIFDKFYRVEHGDSRKTYGYGLGLYISFKLIQAMGGRLWAESQLNEGSTFYFSLPLAGHADMDRPVISSGLKARV